MRFGVLAERDLRELGWPYSRRVVDVACLLVAGVGVPLSSLGAVLYVFYYAPWAAACGVEGRSASLFYGLTYLAFLCAFWFCAEVVLYLVARRALGRNLREEDLARHERSRTP